MFSRIHDKLGTAGLVIAIVALVAALGGTAIAAVGLNGKQKKEVKKIAKKFAGKQGPAGPQGPAGANGKDGARGDTGPAGKNGKSVISGTEAAGSNCADGGSWFEVEGSGSKEFVCNGGSSSGGGGTTLGAGETMTGVWSFSDQNIRPYATISYPLQVPGGGYSNVVWVGVGETEPTNCPGTVEEPKAAPGVLCVYGEQVVDTEFAFPEFVFPSSASGVILEFSAEAGEESRGRGSWALTAATT
jgi:hypothetical protein